MVEESTRIDVILATFNGGDFLRDQLDSVFAQQSVDLNVHVYDDASTDNTREVIRSYIARHQNIVLHERSVGSGGAFESFRAAICDFDPAGDYVAFCDQDDYWIPHKLATQVEVLKRDGAAGCSSSVSAWDGDLDDIKSRARAIDNVGRQTAYDFYFEGGGQGCTYLFTVDAFRALKLVMTTWPCKDLPHDWLLYAVCRLNNLRWTILNEELVCYRQHSNNAFGARGSLRGAIDRMRMLLSSRFRDRRISLCSTLAGLDAAKHAPAIMQLKSESGFLPRVLFALPRLLKLRRFKLHSVVIAVAFIFGFA